MKKKFSAFVLAYLKFFAKLQIAKIRFLQKIKHQNFSIVGITGSSGKSSTLEACQSALSPHFKIKTNEGYNSETGLPLSLLDLKITNYSFFSWFKILLLIPLKFFTNWKTYHILLLEMGIDSAAWPKNMDYLLSVVQPDIGVFLNVSSVHLQNFSSIEAIAHEKAKLINSAQIAIINTQDKLVKMATTNPHIIPIKPIAVKFTDFYLPDVYQIGFGTAIALAQIFKISSSQAVKNIQANFHLPPSRSSLLKGIKNTTLIDSSYNSSPASNVEMLSFLRSFSGPKIAVLGDMRELGVASAVEHQKIYNLALKSANQIISVGQETTKYFGSKSQKFQFWWQAAKYLQQNICGHETILVKGSQNTIFLEELVKSLLANPADSSRLCRQSSYWQKIKKNFRSSQ